MVQHRSLGIFLERHVFAWFGLAAFEQEQILDLILVRWVNLNTFLEHLAEFSVEVEVIILRLFHHRLQLGEDFGRNAFFDFFYNLLEKKNNQNFLPAYKIFVNSDKYHINYSNFNMPTLIMTGENEVGSTPHMSEGISNEIKNSSLFIIKNAKHGATIEQANVVNEKINSFLY